MSTEEDSVNAAIALLSSQQSANQRDDSQATASSNFVASSPDSEDEESELTMQKLIAILLEAVTNERCCPEILPHKTDYVDCMLDQIKCMENNISQLDKMDTRVDLHRLELERMRYILRTYLRIRIRKIETYAHYILDCERDRSSDDKYLSEGETKYAREYAANVDGHFQSTVLNAIPNFHSRTMLGESTVTENDTSLPRIKPKMDSYVFIQSKHAGNVVVRNVFKNRDEIVALQEKSQHLLPYSSIAQLLKDGTVSLI